MPRFSYSPAGDNRLPNYRRHKATGQANVTLSGHDYYLGPLLSKANRLSGSHIKTMQRIGCFRANYHRRANGSQKRHGFVG